jgi:hypothetical protein
MRQKPIDNFIVDFCCNCKLTSFYSLDKNKVNFTIHAGLCMLLDYGIYY